MLPLESFYLQQIKYFRMKTSNNIGSYLYWSIFIAHGVICITHAAFGQEIICIGLNQSNCTAFQPTFESLSLPTSGTGAVLLLTIHQITLSQTLQINHYNSLHIQGVTDITTIDCLPNAGLQFTDVHNLIISDIAFNKCGGEFNSTSMENALPLTVKATLYMSNCTNVRIINVTVDSGIGTGLVFFDCTGTIEVYNSNFTNNRILDTTIESGGGGLYIEFSECSPEWLNTCNASDNQFNSNAEYIISNCHFINNSRNLATDNEVTVATLTAEYNRNGHGGGGMAIWARGYSMDNTVLITDCWFWENKAKYGGGLYFHFQQAAMGLNVSIVNTVFESNIAFQAGGGIDVGSVFIGSPFPRLIILNVEKCIFIENKASYGGGTSVFMSLTHREDPLIFITFKKIAWQDNLAKFAFAMNLRSFFTSHATNHFTPTIVISNSNFSGNKPSMARSNTGLAALHSRVFPVTFDGVVDFVSNQGSGVKLVDSSLIVTQSSTITFKNNVANFGGGVSLIGFSLINVQTNVSLNFINNIAKFQGGAIYAYSIDEQPLSSCFVERLISNLQSEINSFSRPKFYFSDNEASDFKSHSMYISSIVPCSCRQDDNVTIETLECIGEFEFAQNTTEAQQLLTEGSRLSIQKNSLEPLEFIPGKSTKLPVTVYDELGMEVAETLLVSLRNTSSIYLIFSYTASRHVQFIGQPGHSGVLDVSSQNFRNLASSLNVMLSECPPGFIIRNNVCICSVQSDHDHYNGILHCDSGINMTTFISLGFWVGYMPEDGEKAGEDNLYTAICPLGYCNYDDNYKNGFRIQLPPIPSISKLEKLICGNQMRTGILCGDCIDNYSIFFHSWEYRCGDNKECAYGTLKYLLSEILPITIMFTVIIVKGVNFNSGKFNGFILFAQLTQSLSIMANGAIVYEETERLFYEISAVFYGFFNFNFFKTNSLSFCIFKDANFFIIILMEFLTLVYALILVILLVYITRSRCCYKVQIACIRVGIAKSTSLMNGLATFLILCYSQATRLCYQVLNVGRLRGKGEKSHYPLRVFRMGSVIYFTGYHIPFCIAAILIILTVVALPPLLLIAYPMMYKIMPEKLQEYKFMKKVLNRIERYRPLFDAFQGCFRDEHRYFAGIHFVYRSAFVTTFAFVNSRLVFFVTSELILLLMLFLHLWIQPYNNKWHNFTDGLLFLLLAVINMLTLWRYFLSYVHVRQMELFAVGVVQLILLFLPGLFFIMFLVYMVIKKFQKKKSVQSQDGEGVSDFSLLDYRAFTDSLHFKTLT